jgi:aminoglycoside phosphotransferase family enzyme/predicted kinase
MAIMPQRSALAAYPPLITALARDLSAEVVETHISWVLLGDGRAWKIKKPLTLAFLDYGTLAQRENACREELRLNRRLAPSIYLGVTPIGGSAEAPRLGAEPAIEWTVEMRRFDCTQEFQRLCATGALAPRHLIALAQQIADFQRAAAVAPPNSPYGTPENVLAEARENFAELTALLPASDGPTLAQLAVWTENEFERIAPILAERRQQGCVREGHGDLHLGNLVLIDDVPVAFDGIEFNASLRWIDVASEVAFTWADLLDHCQPGLAACFLSVWREASGDTGALAVMRFFAAYRAVVRAKVAAIRATQEKADHRTGAAAADCAAGRDYLALAGRIAVPPAPTLTITVGVSGSGKTTASSTLLAADGDGMLLRLRSDVERKRLFGLAPLAESASVVNAGIYTREATLRTFALLREFADELLRAGWSVVVDAAFLRRAERDEFRQLAAARSTAFRILECTAPVDELRRRVTLRTGDASEATVEVLDRQLGVFEPLGEDETGERIVQAAATTTANSIE